MQQFKSSYYLLFLLQWLADLGVFVVAEFLVLYINANSTKFYYTSDGALQLTAGTFDTLFTTITCVISGITVLICSTFYISAVYKHRRSKRRTQSKNLEWRLLISALVSSAGALMDFIGLLISLLADIDSPHGRLVFTVVTRIGYIQFELAITMTVWIHLLLVKNVRLLMCPKLCGALQSTPTTSIHILDSK
ncbi:hypothetical protein Q1695_007028 [Nippostrongylus brasiliensis]|nr:hypothetical protein Q1695_007028 [Nippostrongylus brasiliensis]